MALSTAKTLSLRSPAGLARRQASSARVVHSGGKVELRSESGWRDAPKSRSLAAGRGGTICPVHFLGRDDVAALPRKHETARCFPLIAIGGR